MSQRPNVEDTLERALHDGVAKELGAGRGARHVDEDLVQHGAVVVGALGVREVKVERERVDVLTPLALELAESGGRRVGSEGWEVEGSDRMRG